MSIEAMTGANGSSGAPIPDAVRAVARAREPDRYLAALRAPRGVRADLAVLAAFSGEIWRIGASSREAMIGEIKLQWWRDALHAGVGGTLSGHPVADALADVARRHGLDRDLLDAPIEARSLELARAVPGDLDGFSAHLGQAETSLFRLALRVLGCDAMPEAMPAAASAGLAYGLARHAPLVMEVTGAGDPAALIANAGDALATARAQFTGHDAAAIPAFLPLVMVEPYLRVLERRHADKSGHGVDVAPLRRVWRIWRASRRAKF